MADLFETGQTAFQGHDADFGVTRGGIPEPQPVPQPMPPLPFVVWLWRDPASPMQLQCSFDREAPVPGAQRYIPA